MRRDINDFSYARLEIRLTEQEKENIRKTAKNKGMSMSEFIRYACERVFQEEE